MAPLCRYFGECGGCSKQHIEYEMQLQAKKKLVEIAAGHEALVFSGNPYGYRNRLDMVFEGWRFGLRRKNNPEKIIEVMECPISDDKINKLIEELQSFFRSPCAISHVIIRSGNESSLHFMLKEGDAKLAEGQIGEFALSTTAQNVSIGKPEGKVDVLKGSKLISVKYLGKKFAYPVTSFFQNNHEMAEKMQEYCNGLLKKYDTKNATLLDVYAGVGTFGIINSGLFKSVAIVENVKEAVDAAEANIAENKAGNAKAYALDASQIGRLKLGSRVFVIADPPRSGMQEKALIKLKELAPEVLIYVSCNPAQLRKDIKKFSKYGVKSAALFDFFPQTNHVEAVVELTRK